jgi:hypothetical protein
MKTLVYKCTCGNIIRLEMQGSHIFNVVGGEKLRYMGTYYPSRKRSNKTVVCTNPLPKDMLVYPDLDEQCRQEIRVRKFKELVL